MRIHSHREWRDMGRQSKCKRDGHRHFVQASLDLKMAAAGECISRLYARHCPYSRFTHKPNQTMCMSVMHRVICAHYTQSHMHEHNEKGTGHWHKHRHRHNHKCTLNYTQIHNLNIQCTRALDIRFHLISTTQRRDVDGTYTQHKNVDDNDDDDALHRCVYPYFCFALMFNCWLDILFDATSVGVLLAFVVYVQNSLQFKLNFSCRCDIFKIRFFIE